MNDPKTIMYNLIVNLSIADHLGDAYEDVIDAAEMMGCEIPDFDDRTETLISQGYYGLRGSFEPEEK